MSAICRRRGRRETGQHPIKIGRRQLCIARGKDPVLGRVIAQSSYQLIDFLRRHLVDVLAQLVHALLEVVCRHALARHDHERIVRDQRHRFEIRALVITQREHGAVEHVSRPVSQHRRVAVGRGGSDAANTDRARSAGHVLDDDRLAERLAHALGHDAANRIRRAARSERDDERDRSRRIRLCRCNRARPHCERKCEHELLSHAEITKGSSLPQC